MNCPICPAPAASNEFEFCEECWLIFLALAKCPVGLFLSQDQTCLCLMTDGFFQGLRGMYRDAYVVATGKFYWGRGLRKDRDQLRVYPCRVVEE